MMFLRTCALAFAGGLSLCTLPALADEAPVELEPVLVTATRSSQPELRLPAAVRVIGVAEIEASGAASLAEVLRFAGGLQVTDLAGDGLTVQVDARAFGDAANANTLVLLDGRRLNNPDVDGPDLASVALKDIERIEIIEGSAGALYGDQAVGGVINIITRAGDGGGAAVEAFGGSYSARGGRATAALQSGTVRAQLSGEYSGTHNYRDNNQVEYRNLRARLGHAAAGREVFLEFGAVAQDARSPGPLNAAQVSANRRQAAPNYRGDFVDTDTVYYRLGGRLPVGDDWAFELDQTLRRSQGVFRLSSVFGAETQDAYQDRDLLAINPRLVGTPAMLAGRAQLTLGADLQRADYHLASRLGVQDNQQQQADVYGQAVLPVLRAVDLTVGARTARVSNTVFDGFTFTAPTRLADDESAFQAGLGWRLGTVRTFARVDQAYRYAKVDEMTLSTAAAGSNQNPLQTQQGRTLELGADIGAEGLEAGVTLFRLDNDQEIAYDPTAGPFGFGANINLPSTRRDGVSARLRWQALPWLTLGASGQYVDARIDQGPLAGRDIPMAASRLAQASATAALPRRFSVQLGAAFTGERALSGDFDNTLPPLPPYALAHLALGWRIAGAELALRIDNLLDRRYSEFGASGLDPGTFAELDYYQPSPERRYAVRARLEF